MRLFTLAFLCGVLALQNFRYLPPKIMILILSILSVFIIIKRIKNLRWLVAFLLGFSWCLFYVYLQLAWTLPAEWEGKNITVNGLIASIPNSENHLTSFLFALKKIEYQGVTKKQSTMVRLTVRDFNTYHVGDQWRFVVRLKKIHGTMNPGGFDYEAWALQEGIRASGYVVKSNQNQLLKSDWYRYFIDRIREKIKNIIIRDLPTTQTSPWILALTVGERHGISEENWDVLRKTGTNHLMAIAGLHIGFVSAFMYLLVNWIWRFFPSCMMLLPASHAGAVAGWLMALIYGNLSGFLLPAQRAVMMLSVCLFIILKRRKLLAWHAWCASLLFVLLMNPLNVLTESFWLSFGAVAIIIYGMNGRLALKGWQKWGRIQWILSMGLIPFSLWLFQQSSLTSFLANSIAIPWVGFCVVPLCLVGVFLLLFSTKLGILVLIGADKSLSLLWTGLTWLAHLDWGAWYQVMPNTGILILSCVGMVILLLPQGFPGKWLGCIAFLPLLFFQNTKPKLGEMWVTLLDVGQGLATVVQTTNHVLVFDTGPKLSANFDMGASVVVPFLRTEGIKDVDMLVVSHGDNDHIGGSSAILKQIPTKLIKTSVPYLFSKKADLCLRGQSWQWDQVNFKFLYPTPEFLNFGNDSSCVLQISNQTKTILLTGDIEKFAEKKLLELNNNISADILFAPHHGSKTSGDLHFIEQVHPEYVLFATGYRNRYHFPHPAIVERYSALGVKQVNTVEAGAIQFRIANATYLEKPLSYRTTRHHYWNS